MKLVWSQKGTFIDQEETGGLNSIKDMSVISSLRGVGGKSGSGTKDREMLSVGFIICRGWWSREADVKVLLGLTRFDVLGLAEPWGY